MNKKIGIFIAVMVCAHSSVKAGPGMKITLMLYDFAKIEYARYQKEQKAAALSSVEVLPPPPLKPTALARQPIILKNTTPAYSKPILNGFKVLPSAQTSGAGSVGLAGALSDAPKKPGIVHRPIHIDTITMMLDRDIKERTGTLSRLDQQFKEAEQGLLVVLRSGSIQEKKTELHTLVEQLKKLQQQQVTEDVAMIASNLIRGAEDELMRMGERTPAR